MAARQALPPDGVPLGSRLIIFARPVGLFSLFTQVVGQLVRCRRLGAVPLVYFNRQCLYWSDHGYRGARNAWEYYFEPVSDGRIEEWVDAERAKLEDARVTDFDRHLPDDCARHSPDPSRDRRLRTAPGVLVSNQFPTGTIDWVFEMAPRWRRQLADVVHRHIVVRAEIAEQVEAFRRSELAGRKVIGVHVRGVERAVERRPFAPQGSLPLACYTREVDAYLDRQPDAAVFCATDSQASLEAFQARYGPKLISRAATRLPPALEAQGLHYSSATRSIRAQLGEEVLIECLLLARCDALIHGPSNVSLAAQLFQPDLPCTDVYRKYGRSRPAAWLLHQWQRRRDAPAPFRLPVRRTARRVWAMLWGRRVPGAGVARSPRANGPARSGAEDRRSRADSGAEG